MTTGSQTTARVFAALADPVRLELVAQLAEGDTTVGQLAAPHEISVQAVSKHLKVLEGAGVVERVGTGHRAPVHLNAEVFQLVDAWAERYRRRVASRSRRLDAVLTEVAPARGRRRA